MVRNGFLPERELQTGLGPVTVKIPKAYPEQATKLADLQTGKSNVLSALNL